MRIPKGGNVHEIIQNATDAEVEIMARWSNARVLKHCQSCGDCGKRRRNALVRIARSLPLRKRFFDVGKTLASILAHAE